MVQRSGVNPFSQVGFLRDIWGVLLTYKGTTRVGLKVI